MSLIQLSVKHNRTREEARSQLETAVQEVRNRFGSMVQRVEWSSDRYAVKMVGTGFEAEMHVDAQEVHVSADLPFLGGLLGSPFVLAGVRSIYNVVTMTTCTLHWCSADVFQRALREDGGRVADVQRLHNLEIVSLTARLADMAVKSSEQRLVQFLNQHADDARAFRHFEIASFIRVTPEHLSRMLKKMAKAGTVRRAALTKVSTASDRSSRRRRVSR